MRFCPGWDGVFWQCQNSADMGRVHGVEKASCPKLGYAMLRFRIEAGFALTNLFYLEKSECHDLKIDCLTDFADDCSQISAEFNTIA